jgi:hypothetical protein
MPRFITVSTTPQRWMSYVVGQWSSRTRHRVLAMAALDKSLGIVWWRWHISVSQLIYDSLFLSGIYYCLRVFWCAATRMSELEFAKPHGEARWHFGPCHYRWWNMSLPIRPWNEAAKCTIEHCQFPTTKNNSASPNQGSNNVDNFFYIIGIVHYEFVPTGQSTKFTSWKYWKGWVKKLHRNDPNFLPTTRGSCVTTMHLLTWHCLWGRCWHQCIASQGEYFEGDHGGFQQWGI